MLKLLIMLLLLLGDLLTFRQRSSLSGYLWLLQIIEYLQLEATNTTKNYNTASRSKQIEPRERLLQKIGQAMLELVRRIQNIDVFLKNLIRTATNLVESRLFQRQRFASSEGKNGYFQSLDLYHQAMVSSNFRSFSMRPEMFKNNPNYQSALGYADPKMLQTYPGAGLTYFTRVWNFSTFFSTKEVLSELEKNCNAIFHSRPWMKVELSENGRGTSNMGSKGYVWLLVRSTHGIASETQKFLVEAVWVMPSVTGCHTLSTPIRKTKHNISDGGTSRYTFATSFNGTKPKEKAIRSKESLLKVFHDYSQIVNAMTKIKNFRFREEKLNGLELTRTFAKFRPIWRTKSQVHIQAGSICVAQFFCEIKYQYCYT